METGLAAKAEVDLVDPAAAKALAKEHPHPESVLFLEPPASVERVKFIRMVVDPVVESLVLADVVVALEVVPCFPHVHHNDPRCEHVFPS